jgi:hypothetical protein
MDGASIGDGRMHVSPTHTQLHSYISTTDWSDHMALRDRWLGGDISGLLGPSTLGKSTAAAAARSTDRVPYISGQVLCA